LLPIFRSRQQAQLLARLLDNPEGESSLSDLSTQLYIPVASVHREVERAERAGLVRSRRVGNSRLVSANPDSPYHEPLRQLLVMAFGPPELLRAALDGLAGITAAYLFGSWAARWQGEEGPRPPADIDLLVLGDPDRDQVYAAVNEVSTELGRQVQATIRPADWLESGEGSFHDTVVSRPIVSVLSRGPQEQTSTAAATAR
jgi:predicted nucleotidyltransferase